LTSRNNLQVIDLKYFFVSLVCIGVDMFQNLVGTYPSPPLPLSFPSISFLPLFASPILVYFIRRKYRAVTVFSWSYRFGWCLPEGRESELSAVLWTTRLAKNLSAQLK